jgi:septin family protein
MKIKNSILLLVLSYSSLFASHLPSFITVANTTVTVKSFILSSKEMTFNIYDQNGLSIYSEDVNSINRDRKYNLSKLAIGQYTFEISNELKTIRNRFELRSNSIELIGDEETLFLPIIKNQGNKIDVNMMSLSQPVNIQIKDQFDNVLLNETYVNSVVQKRFDISRLTPGEYVLSINSNGRYFYESIQKN